MPGSTTTTPQQSRLPPQRHDFKTDAAKRCYKWRLKQKQKKARAAARAAAACPEETTQHQVPEEPEEPDEWYISDDLSDSEEACFIRAARQQVDSCLSVSPQLSLQFSR